MNWGKGIIIAMLLFMGFIAFLISMMLQNGDGLEEQAYYEKGNRYDEKLDKLNNAAVPGKGVQISWDAGRNMVRLVFSEENKPDSGRLNVLRPSNVKNDFMLKLIPSLDTQFVSWEGKQRGLWKFQCDWTRKGKAYLHEQELLVP
ncbi:MAG: FixH family protein [Bacteroidetes bacterium]|nr:FixH family protein [Bacteroidota bacterium]